MIILLSWHVCLYLTINIRGMFMVVYGQDIFFHIFTLNPLNHGNVYGCVWPGHIHSMCPVNECLPLSCAPKTQSQIKACIECLWLLLVYEWYYQEGYYQENIHTWLCLFGYSFNNLKMYYFNPRAGVGNLFEMLCLFVCQSTGHCTYSGCAKQHFRNM